MRNRQGGDAKAKGKGKIACATKNVTPVRGGGGKAPETRSGVVLGGKGAGKLGKWPVLTGSL